MGSIWPGLVRVIELTVSDASGNVLSVQRDLRNILHQDGEAFILRAAFIGGQNSSVIPSFYYLGLDNRAAVAAADTIDDLSGEPTGNGYERQQISSNGSFALNLEDGHYLATSPIVSFRAVSGNWGPVANLFLTDKADDTGSLISTVVLASPISLTSGTGVTLRIGMQIKDC